MLCVPPPLPPCSFVDYSVAPVEASPSPSPSTSPSASPSPSPAASVNLAPGLDVGYSLDPTGPRVTFTFTYTGGTWCVVLGYVSVAGDLPVL